MKILFAAEDIFIFEPLGIMQVIAIAKRMRHDCYFATYSSSSFMDAVKRIKPDMVAISIMSISDNSCKALVKKIKDYSKDIFVIVGGPHPTFYPAFMQTCEADAICIGEGDGAFGDLLKSLEGQSDISKIPNIHTKASANPARLLVENLDALPFPDRDLVYKNTRMGMTKIKSFMATRGCPYSCTYCFNSGYKELYAGKGKMLRRRSVDNLIEEIKTVKAKYPLELIRFGDDVFISQMNAWLEEFTDKYRKEIKLPFYCLLSPKVVTQEVARCLNVAGCVSASISIECGNEAIRYKILNRFISDQEIINACRTLVDNGINTYANIMAGLPEATLDDELSSLDIAFKSRVTCVAFTIFTPFPGTKLYEHCVEKRLIPKEENPVFPRSTTDRSALNCFTEREKDIQRNIMLLAILANRNKFLRYIILKWLIYFPAAKIFFYISFLARNYYLYRHIYPIPLDIKEFFEYVKVVFEHDKKYIE